MDNKTPNMLYPCIVSNGSEPNCINPNQIVHAYLQIHLDFSSNNSLSYQDFLHNSITFYTPYLPWILVHLNSSPYLSYNLYKSILLHTDVP